MDCPNCHHSDAVQSAGAAGIAAPVEPSSAPASVARVVQVLGGCYFLVPAGIIGASIVLMVLMFLVNMALMSQDPVGGGMAAVMSGIGFIPLLLCAMPLLAVIGLAALGIPMLIRRHVAAAHEATMGRWRTSADRFRSLLYCSRCAGVFMEGQNRLVPLEHMAAFLNEQPTAPPPGTKPGGS